MELNRTFQHTLLRLIALLAVAAPSQPSLCIGQTSPSVNRILQDWTTRESRTLTLDIGWTEELSRAVPSDGDAFSSVPTSPSELSQHKYTRKLAIDGQKLRFDDEMPAWYPQLAAFQFDKTASSDDGHSTTTLIKHAAPGRFPYQGQIEPAGALSSQLRSLVDLQPLLDHYRPSLRLANLLRRAQVSATVGKSGDHTCVIAQIRRKSGSSWINYSVWIDADPEAESAVRRICEDCDGKLIAQQDRDYTNDDKCGLLLTGWRILEMAPTGQVERSVSAKVVSQRINRPLSADVFRIEFPPGTIVIDRTSKDQQFKVVQPDLSTRTVSQRDLDGSAPVDFMGRRSSALAICAVVGAVILAGIAIAASRWRRSVLDNGGS